MLRTALSPRWLGSLAVVLALAAGMVWLGLWQMAVAREDAQQQALREAAARPVVALDAVLPPHTAFPADGSNRMVTATGHYEPARTRLVPDRLLAGRTGYWVVTPLVVEATGARIAVVRGFTRSAGPDGGPPPTLTGPTGQLTLTGSLAPTESPTVSRQQLPPGQIPSVHVGTLLNDWGGEVYNGFLFAVAESPTPADVGAAGATAADPAALERVPPPALPTGVTLRNAAYAAQWWVFAAFVLFMWARMVRDDHRRREHPAAPAGEDPTDDPADQAGEQP